MCSKQFVKKNVTAWWMYETRTHAVYAVRLVICRFGSIFYAEIESAMECHCRSPPLEIFETD